MWICSSITARSRPQTTATGGVAEAQYNANHWFGVVGGFWRPLRQSNHLREQPHTGWASQGHRLFVSGWTGGLVPGQNKTKRHSYPPCSVSTGSALVGARLRAGRLRWSALATTYTDAAVMLGGGVDFKVSRHFSIRLAQLDEFYTTHNLNQLLR